MNWYPGVNWSTTTRSGGKKVAENPTNGVRLLSASFKTDTFLLFTRPLMRFDRPNSSQYITESKCQKSFCSICLESTSSSSTISVPTRQLKTWRLECVHKCWGLSAFNQESRKVFKHGRITLVLFVMRGRILQ